MKNVIENHGYTKASEDNIPYQGAYVTHYMKTVDTAKKIENNHIQIILSFKINDLSSGYYMNFGFAICSIDYEAVPEIRNEINTIETIVYDTLAENYGLSGVEKRK